MGTRRRDVPDVTFPSNISLNALLQSRSDSPLYRSDEKTGTTEGVDASTDTRDSRRTVIGTGRMSFKG